MVCNFWPWGKQVLAPGAVSCHNVAKISRTERGQERKPSMKNFSRLLALLLALCLMGGCALAELPELPPKKPRWKAKAWQRIPPRRTRSWLWSMVKT